MAFRDNRQMDDVFRLQEKECTGQKYLIDCFCMEFQILGPISGGVLVG